MAAVLGISAERLRHLASNEGMPRVGRGLYALAACVQWYIQYKVLKAQALAAPTKSRAEEARATILEAKASEATGMMVSKLEVAQEADAAYLRLGAAFETLPGSLGRECNLPPDAVRKLRARLDVFRQNFARDLDTFMPKKPEANGKSSRRA